VLCKHEVTGSIPVSSTKICWAGCWFGSLVRCGLGISPASSDARKTAQVRSRSAPPITVWGSRSLIARKVIVRVPPKHIFGFSCFWIAAVERGGNPEAGSPQEQRAANRLQEPQGSAFL
jgi:hypothetical protein